MGENLVTALEITVIGMALVFGAIILLWGVMALLVRLAQDHPDAPAASDIETPAEDTLALEREKRAGQRGGYIDEFSLYVALKDITIGRIATGE